MKTKKRSAAVKHRQALPQPVPHRAELDRRWAAYEANPGIAISRERFRETAAVLPGTRVPIRDFVDTVNLPALIDHLLDIEDFLNNHPEVSRAKVMSFLKRNYPARYLAQTSKAPASSKGLGRLKEGEEI